MPPRLGTAEWERAGGPPITAIQHAGLLLGMAGVLLGHAASWFGGGFVRRAPYLVDLDTWAPPDSKLARDAEQLLLDTSSTEFVNHSYRSYYFSAVLCDIAGMRHRIDPEVLYVSVLLHDVGLFVAPVEGEHCFSVTGARLARGLAAENDWDAGRADRLAASITANLNPRVPQDVFGAEAYWFRRGGIVDVLAQGWKIHPRNLDQILTAYPRDGFSAETGRLVAAEVSRNPRCRFAGYGAAFPKIVRWVHF
jgi:hypothetical protein